MAVYPNDGSICAAPVDPADFLRYTGCMRRITYAKLPLFDRQAGYVGFGSSIPRVRAQLRRDVPSNRDRDMPMSHLQLTANSSSKPAKYVNGTLRISGDLFSVGREPNSRPPSRPSCQLSLVPCFHHIRHCGGDSPRPPKLCSDT